MCSNNCNQGRSCDCGSDPCLFSTDDVYQWADFIGAFVVVVVVAAIVWGALV